MEPGSESLRLPPGRKPVRCTRKHFARGMPPTNRGGRRPYHPLLDPDDAEP